MAYDKVVDSVALDNKIQAIADKIKTKAPAPYNTKQLDFNNNDFIDAIDTLNGLKIVDSTSLTPFTENGEWTVTASKGEAMASCKVVINVPSGGLPVRKVATTITTNGRHHIVAPEGCTMSEVIATIDVSPTLPPAEEKIINIIQNGQTIVEPSEGNLLSKVIINANVPTGGGSDVEVVDFVPPALPTFRHQTGTFELWGWGIKDADVAWMSEYYTFHGNVYSGAIDDVDHEMALTIVNGQPQGIPEMTRGKCLAVVR